MAEAHAVDELSGEAVVVDLVVDDAGALPDADEPRERREVGGQIGGKVEHDATAVSAGRDRGS